MAMAYALHSLKGLGKGMAKHYKVSERTIDRWVKTGGLPGPGPAGCWTRNEILRRDRERE